MVDAPLCLHTATVQPDWIDYNQHMNLAFFVLVFDHATDAFFDYVGLDAAYRERTGYSPFLLETHVTYLHQMKLGEPMRFEMQLLDYDQKLLHYYQTMYHAEQGFEAANTELLFMNIDTRQGRSVAMTDDVLQYLEEIMTAHRSLPRPANVGRVMGIRRG